MNTNIELFNKIKEYQTITIFGHTSPDGDCYGAQAGLKSFIQETFPDKKVYILGSGISKGIAYFGKMDVIDDEIIKESLAVVLDVSDLERIEDQRVSLAKEIIKFDHHINSDKEGFASMFVSDVEACSTCQMIGQFIIDNGYVMSKDTAERLFLGIVTDSGRFLYLSSSKNLFVVMNEIMKAEIDFQKIYDFLYEGDEIGTRARGYVTYNFKKSKHGVAYIVLNKEKLSMLHIDTGFAAGLVNSLSAMKGMPIWAIFCENEDGVVRVELRSKNFNVQEVATKFGGGGHLRASGCRLNSIHDCHKVVHVLDKLIERGK